MKLTLTLLLIALVQVKASVFAQRVSIHVKDQPLEYVLNSIRNQTGYDVFFNAKALERAFPVTVSLKNSDLKTALKAIFEGQPFDFLLELNTVVVRSRAKPASSGKGGEVLPQRLIAGNVVDELGKPIKGVNVLLGKGARTVTDESGRFVLRIGAAKVSQADSLVFTHLAYQRLSVPLPAGSITVTMKALENQIDEVVVTGMMQRKRESFTGAVASFSGAELKAVNNQNLIQSLRALDPSFIQIENNAAGSNPNILPTIELRGQTSISTDKLRDEFSTDPNQPLFILDGFETNLRTIVDLDMNLVQSITILKDAASTAMYGSRASNGIVVVETMKPSAGKVQLSYTSDLNLQAADLSGYNMMNASEKLEFERLSGRYTAQNNIYEVQLALDSLYARRLAEVVRGVNTYWLSQPLQTGFSQRHSISARGGQGAVLFDLGANYKNTKGAMIGSKRDDWGANLQVNYRIGKLNLSNRAFISGYSSGESPYGSFSTWVNTNPYYRLLGANERYLDDSQALMAGYRLQVSNPLYNASLNSYNRSSNVTISDNLQLIYSFNESFRLQTGIQLQQGNTDLAVFVSPLDARFYDVQYDKKGTYQSTGQRRFTYTANAMLTYAKVFAGIHQLTTNLRAEISDATNKQQVFSAVGFPSSADGNPSFSFGYPEGGKPSSSSRITRRNSLVYSMNYSYNKRYNADVNVNLDGSTAFGSNNRYAPYYSGGLSWNLHEEEFMKASSLDVFRIRGNIGITGNQNFGNVSQSVYSYYATVDRFGQGVYLSALGTPDLEWQKTRQLSLGLDLAAWHNRFNMQVNAYDKYTDPLVVAVTLPSSTGLQNYPMNAGALTVRGVETIVNFSPIYRPQDRIILTLGITGSMLKQTYSKFDHKLDALNDELRESNSLTRYRDGYSPNDIWAVRSLGIDPATGREIFRSTTTGEQTFTYNSDDIVVVGNSQPKAEGTFRVSMTYKGFYTNIILRYIAGRDQLNTALYNKVENISLSNVENNQDRRALYDRWKQPGDVSQFKSISITTTTPISSRFVQRENTLSGESLNVGYEFRDAAWLASLKLSNLRLTGYMNELFYWSSIRRERGIEYPFARSFSLSLNATFK